MTLSNLILDAAKKDAVAAKALELYEADSSTLEVVSNNTGVFIHVTKYGETEPCQSLTVEGGIDGVVNSLQAMLSVSY